MMVHEPATRTKYDSHKHHFIQQITIVFNTIFCSKDPYFFQREKNNY